MIKQRYVFYCMFLVVCNLFSGSVFSRKEEVIEKAIITVLPDPDHNNKINYHYKHGLYYILVGTVTSFATGKDQREIAVPQELFESFPIEHQLAVLQTLNLMNSQQTV
ncbi:MAG: hypothetical protein ACJAZS_000602 [Alteromonas naphthalenivorans]|jgi:hypothetical protein